jgi:hypothetical protein
MCFNSETSSILLSESEADKKAVSELEKQLKTQKGIRAELTKAKLKELKIQIKAESKMKKALDKSRRDFIRNFKGIAQSSNPLSLMNLTNSELTDLAIAGGYSSAIDEFIEQTDNISQAAQTTASIIDARLVTSPNQSMIIDMMKRAATQRIFDDLILPKVNSGVREALNNLTVDVPINLAMSSLAQNLEQAEKKQLTEINTQISIYGRSVTASIAEEAGITHYLYTGPEDGLTRSFCRPLVNKVISSSQMNKLNNGQGLSVRTAGGGYNCRHSWSPVTEGFIQAANLQEATSADISKANSGGKRK